MVSDVAGFLLIISPDIHVSAARCYESMRPRRLDRFGIENPARTLSDNRPIARHSFRTYV